VDDEGARRSKAELAEPNARLRALVSEDAEPIDRELRHLLDVLPVLVFVLDAEDRYEKFRQGRAPLAVPPEAFLGRRIEEVFPPPLSTRFQTAVEQARASQATVTVDYELPIGGETQFFAADFVPLPDGRSAIFANDVTARSRAERALQESERRFRTLIEKATDVLYVIDPALNVVFWSPGATEALGWTAEEMLGAFGPGFIHPDDLHVIGFPDPEESGQLVRLTYRVRHKNGSYRTLDAIVRNCLGDPAVKGVIVNARDVTEQRLLEARSAESQKLESIGRLAGGIAHDFNNLLTVILNCADMQRDAILNGRQPSVDDATEILRAGARARDLTQQLLAFARRQVIAPVVLDPNALLTETQRLLRRLLGEDVTL
jgi:PAS domain S-box-containing protein